MCPNITYSVLIDNVLHEFDCKHKAVEFVVQQEVEKNEGGFGQLFVKNL